MDQALDEILEPDRLIAVMLDGDTVDRGVDGPAFKQHGGARVQVFYV